MNFAFTEEQEQLRQEVRDFLEAEIAQGTFQPREDSWMVGRSLREVALPSQVGAIVAAVRQADGGAVYTPGARFVLKAGQTLILIGRKGVASLIAKLKGPAGGDDVNAEA